MISVVRNSKKLAELEAENTQLAARNKELSAQVQWFQNQLFGKTSERRIEESPKEQLFLGEQFQKETAEEETRTVKEHERKNAKNVPRTGMTRICSSTKMLSRSRKSRSPIPKPKGSAKTSTKSSAKK